MAVIYTHIGGLKHHTNLALISADNNITMVCVFSLHCMEDLKKC